MKAKAKKRSALPKRTDAGRQVQWTTAALRVFEVIKGKLVSTGRKGVCRINAFAPGLTTGGSRYLALSLRYAFASSSAPGPQLRGPLE
ncbi:MAG: hypothetical protein WCP28_03405 [Actinomycetes bacterium]